jgi:hypothetical protein
MNKRHALTLSAILAATVLTGGAAILGLASTPAHVQAAQPAAVVQAQPTQPTTQNWEGRD